MVFLRYPWSIDARLPYFVCLDVIVNPFEALEALQEFICLVNIVGVGEIFPLDVKSLSKFMKLRKFRKIMRLLQCSRTRGRHDHLLCPRRDYDLIPPRSHPSGGIGH